MERCIICLGSNHDGESHLIHAAESIGMIFTDVCWGETIKTEAEGTDNPLPYFNKAGAFTTSMEVEQIRSLFKDMERQHGRTSASKSSGIIPLDIDLLMYGNTLLKPDDMKKNYVQQALASLK